MLAFALLLLVVALLLLVWGTRQMDQRGIPPGKIITLDLHDSQTLQAPLFSKRYQLSGKPDYLIRRGRDWIPVEVKTVNNLHQPYLGHLFQLFAYCLLVEETYGVRPPYGVLHYRSRAPREERSITYQIEYNAAIKEKLLELLTELRRAEQSDRVPRSHHEVARCRECGYAGICDQKLP
jgi:CRISPR-associated exonuclease Cas4